MKQTVAHLRELDGEQHTPVLMAAAGPKALALAAEIADIVTLARAPVRHARRGRRRWPPACGRRQARGPTRSSWR